MKTICQIYIPIELKIAAKEQGINISQVAAEALELKLKMDKDPTQIKLDKERELIDLEKKTHEAKSYLNKLRESEVQMGQAEKAKLLEAQKRKQAYDVRSGYFEIDRDLYNISYAELKREKKLPKKEIERIEAINRRFKKNLKIQTGKNP